MTRIRSAGVVVFFHLLALAAYAQTADTTQAPVAAPQSEWSVGPINFSGLIDGYYDVNFNHPASGDNQLRNFDVKANQFSLNMAKITLEHQADPAGFRIDLGFGRAFDLVNAYEPSGASLLRNVEQAYVSYKPPKTGGLEIDFGKFVTWAGAEVIETNNNWNYSRSLLFALAIPYYHFGLRANEPLGKHFSVGVQAVNGWNDVEDNNSGKTVGVTSTISAGMLQWTNNYMVGNENPRGEKGLRHLYDTTLLLTPNPKTGVYVNFDYGLNRNLLLGNSHWVGVAAAGRYALNSWFALAPRVEWYNDANGYTTGTVQKLKEVTMTVEFKMKEGILSRLEYRRDWSNVPFFERGNSPASWTNQPTLLAGFVAYFGPKR